MSDFGLRVKSAVGAVLLTITDRITRLRYLTQINADTSGNTTLTDITDHSSVEFSVMLETGGDPLQKCQHSVTRTGTQIAWVYQEGYSGAVKVYASAKSAIFVFMYT